MCFVHFFSVFIYILSAVFKFELHHLNSSDKHIIIQYCIGIAIKTKVLNLFFINLTTQSLYIFLSYTLDIVLINKKYVIRFSIEMFTAFNSVIIKFYAYTCRIDVNFSTTTMNLGWLCSMW